MSFRDQMARVDTTLFDFMGETVTYARGALSVSLTAIREDVEIEDESVGQLRLQLGSAAFVIPVDSLLLPTETEPREGDVIRDAAGARWSVTGTGARDADNLCWRVPARRIQT